MNVMYVSQYGSLKKSKLHNFSFVACDPEVLNIVFLQYDCCSQYQ